jgi:hypothetical protein
MTTETETELNEVERMLTKNNPSIFRIVNRSDMHSFLRSPARVKVLFLYMKKCGPCHRTAPQLSLLRAKSSKDLLISCMCSEHLDWLHEPGCKIRFSSGSPPMGFPHMEIYENNVPVGELNEREAPRMLLQLTTDFPFLKGNLDVLLLEKTAGASVQDVSHKTESKWAPFYERPSQKIKGASFYERPSQKMQELKAAYALFKQKQQQQKHRMGGFDTPIRNPLIRDHCSQEQLFTDAKIISQLF